MGFDRYRCVLDRIFSFPKLTKYRRRFCFQKHRIVFISDEKYENESGGAFRLSFPTVSSPTRHHGPIPIVEHQQDKKETCTSARRPSLP